MKKKLLMIALALTAVGFVVYASENVSAYGDQGAMHGTLIQKLVERFGLNEADVQSVFDEVQNDHHQQMQTRFEERLTEEVQNGSITQDQKQMILQKRDDLQKQREADNDSFQNM